MDNITLIRHPETGILIPEEWRSIEGYDGFYDVSNYGRVRSWRAGNGSGKRRGLPKMMSQKIDRYGYPHIGIRKNHKKKFFTIHRLVAIAFIPKPKGKDHVNHKDNDTTNNFYLNLEWCTPKENTGHGVLYGNIEFIGEGSPNSKLTKKEVLEIRSLYRDGTYTQKELGKIYGVSGGHIGQIVNRKSWSHV